MLVRTELVQIPLMLRPLSEGGVLERETRQAGRVRSGNIRAGMCVNKACCICVCMCMLSYSYILRV